ncbi:hypothetical protein HAHE_25210 [Haloferula helveola]|uniref:Halobacterial output domain-containing protein n=1 Tax=Haloferula helveola TaxID=490095 RepID=A0ABM7RN45_9BACT|nr:hypothetical protein HAHE_25210 [Haloferula helveola]
MTIKINKRVIFHDLPNESRLTVEQLLRLPEVMMYLSYMGLDLVEVRYAGQFILECKAHHFSETEES